MNRPNTELEELEAATAAFDRSSTYEWRGKPVVWAERQNWLWLSLIREGNYPGEAMALVAMWVGTRNPESLPGIESRWRNNPEGVFVELGDFLAGFMAHDPETEAAMQLAKQIQKDIGASSDDPDTSDGAEEGEPKK